MLPEVPVMVTGVVTLAVVLAAVSVNTLPDAEFVPHLAVTPLGNFEVIASCTLPVNPPASVTVMVVEPEAPGFMTMGDEAESQKPGICLPARSLIRSCPVALPQPVTRS